MDTVSSNYSKHLGCSTNFWSYNNHEFDSNILGFIVTNRDTLDSLNLHKLTGMNVKLKQSVKRGGLR